jgi:hypothetical protein
MQYLRLLIWVIRVREGWVKVKLGFYDFLYQAYKLCVLGVLEIWLELIDLGYQS